MNFQKLVVALTITLFTVDAVSIDHDKVKPFEQPKAVTISEKAAVKFHPMFSAYEGCASYPAVNAAGETSGGLKGTRGSSECEGSLLGSQVYSRSGWFNDVWGIMYAWYFPKGFAGTLATRRHDWASAVAWIDNPALETPKLLGFMTSYGDKYDKHHIGDVKEGTSPTLLRELNDLLLQPIFRTTDVGGDYQPLITWEQLTEEARTALNTTDFGRAKVPFIDAEFQKRLEKAWYA